MPLDPMVYAEMLGKRISTGGTRVYLVNTGWSGGPYGVGSRVKLKYTRRMVEAAQSGIIDECEFVHDERAYDKTAEKLARMFEENAQKRLTSMTEEVRAAGPHPLSK